MGLCQFALDPILNMFLCSTRSTDQDDHLGSALLQSGDFHPDGFEGLPAVWSRTLVSDAACERETRNGNGFVTVQRVLFLEPVLNCSVYIHVYTCVPKINLCILVLLLLDVLSMHIRTSLEMYICRLVHIHLHTHSMSSKACLCARVYACARP